MPDNGGLVSRVSRVSESSESGDVRKRVPGKARLHPREALETKVGAVWQQSRWPHAEFEVTEAKYDLRQQQREKTEESRERTENREDRFGSRMVGWHRKSLGP